MLKKSKNTKYPPLPTPPTAEEMLEDLETFHVDLKTLPSRGEQANTDGQPDWWTRFEQAVANHKNLKELSTEIRNCKLKLESTKIELETEAQLLKNAIEEQQEKVEELLEKGSG